MATAPIPMPEPKVTPAPISSPPQGQLAPFYTDAAQARAGGYSWDEINTHVAGQWAAAQQAGYSDQEIAQYLTGSPERIAPDAPGPTAVPEGAPQHLRDFANKYLKPTDLGKDYGPTGGDLLRAMGHSIVDVGKMFGHAIVDGAAATMDLLNGKFDPISDPDDYNRLAQQSMNFTGLFMGGGGIEAEGERTLANALPSQRAMLDAGTAVAKAGGDMSPEAINEGVQAVGHHFVQTGEHPAIAAVKAAQDPEFRAQLVRRIKLPPATPLEKSPSIAPIGNVLSNLLADESGAVQIAKLPPLTPETIGMKHPDLAASVAQDAKRLLNPASMAPLARGVIREGLAETAAKMQRSSEQLRQFGRAVGELSSDDRAEYMDAIETGDLGKYEGTPLESLATELRTQFDDRWNRLNELGVAPAYVENYLPHLWNDPDGVLRHFSTKRPFEGTKAFTKSRVFDTIREGVNAGFTLRTDNPIEMSLMQLHQMDRLITAKTILNELDTRGLVREIAHGERVPADLAGINDKVAINPRGRLYAPQPVADMINNYLSPGLGSRPIYQVMRSATNMLNSWQLGFSAFHGGFVTADAMTSAIAKGIKQISRGTVGEAAEGAKSILTAPAKPFMNYAIGRKVIQQVLGHRDYGPEMQTMADALIRAGGRVGLSPEYRGSAYGSFWRAIQGTFNPASGQRTLAQELHLMFSNEAGRPIMFHGVKILPGMVRAAAQIVPRVLDTVGAPLMEHYVPAMKAGVFADLMRDEMRVNPDMGIDEVRATGARLWDSVDNRLGQIIYDNLFWHKTLLDMGHISVRSLGWNLGTIRELGGGLTDLARGRMVDAGSMKQISDRASYVVALPVATALMGAVYGALKGTWKPDWGIKDYMFPPTGGTDREGGPERISLPGYLKDAYDWSSDPLQTASNKLNPLWPTVYDMMTNQQWNGAAITDPRAPFMTNAHDYADFLAQQFEPITMQHYAPVQTTNLTPAERFFGLREAPYRIRDPQLNEAWEDKQTAEKVHKMLEMQQQREEDNGASGKN